jgi:hypothetical protein
MFKVLSVQSISAFAAAALVGAVAAFLAPVAPQAKAESQSKAASDAIRVDAVHAKGDRLPRLVTGRACSSASWPNYDQVCQFDLRRSADDVRVVRIVNMGRP